MKPIATDGIATDLRPVLFAGQVIHRANGEVTPLSNVTFMRHETDHRDPYLVEIGVDDNGEFSTELQLITTIIGKDKYERGTTIIVESPGCDPRRVSVSDEWEFTIIELQCDS